MASVVAGAVAVVKAVGTWFATSTIGTSMLTSAAVGATIGAGMTLIQGGDLGDVVEGAAKGAVTGGVTGGVLGFASSGIAGLSPGSVSTPGVGTGSVGASSAAGKELANASAHIAAKTGSAATASVPTAGTSVGANILNSSTKNTAQNITKNAGSNLTGGVNKIADKSTGILSKVGNWADENPFAAGMAAQSLGSAASGLLESRADDKQIEALMERDRLNRDANQLKLGVVRTPSPTLTDGYKPLPKWELDENGIIQEVTDEPKQ